MIQPVLKALAPLVHILGLHREDISQESMTIRGEYPKPGIETCGPFYMQLRMRCLCERWQAPRSNLALPDRRYKVSPRGGMRLMRTKGRRRAVVAVARKLAILMHRMWIDGSEFRQDQVGGMA